MKRWWFGGLGLLMLAIVVQFPAAWLAPVVSRATNERWRLADADGTVWHGRAALYSFDRTTGSWSPGRALRWRVLWTRLASGELAAQLDFADGGEAKLVAGARGWLLQAVDATFPAGQLAVLLPSAIGDYGWGGTLAARVNTFGCAWSRFICSGQIELAWNAASTIQIPGPPLGDYRLRIVAEGDALQFDVSTTRGRLQLAGAGAVAAAGLRFTGEAHAAVNDDVRLDSLLRAIGRPGSAPGRYLIEYREATSVR